MTISDIMFLHFQSYDHYTLIVVIFVIHFGTCFWLCHFKLRVFFNKFIYKCFWHKIPEENILIKVLINNTTWNDL